MKTRVGEVWELETVHGEAVVLILDDPKPLPRMTPAYFECRCLTLNSRNGDDTTYIGEDASWDARWFDTGFSQRSRRIA